MANVWKENYETVKDKLHTVTLVKPFQYMYIFVRSIR